MARRRRRASQKLMTSGRRALHPLKRTVRARAERRLQMSRLGCWQMRLMPAHLAASSRQEGASAWRRRARRRKSTETMWRTSPRFACRCARARPARLHSNCSLITPTFAFFPSSSPTSPLPPLLPSRAPSAPPRPSCAARSNGASNRGGAARARDAVSHRGGARPGDGGL